MCNHPQFNHTSVYSSEFYKVVSFLSFFLFVFWPCFMACRILVFRTGIEPRPLALKAQNPNYWTTREFQITREIISAAMAGTPIQSAF